MEKANKNTHLNHLEDNIFLGHIDGTREAIKFIREFRDILKGHADRPSGGTSVKWDGAPAIWLGPHPQTGEVPNRMNAKTPDSSNTSQPHEALLFQIHMLMKERGLQTRIDVTYPYEKIDEQTGQVIERF